MTFRSYALAVASAAALIVCPPPGAAVRPPSATAPSWGAQATSPDVLVAGVDAIIAGESPNIPPHRRRALAIVIVSESLEAGLDPYLTTAVITAESTFRSDLVSHRGAVGLMQLIPSTAASMVLALPMTPEVSDLHEPAVNLRLGIAYLIQLRERFGSWQLALTAYHMGPERLAKRQRQNKKLPEGYSKAVFRNYLDYKGQLAQARQTGYGSFRT